MKDTVYFISDAHLGLKLKGCEEREKHLTVFLRHIASSASDLFIVGDLFDFWIEYRHAIRPNYFPILYELKKLIDNGTTVVYLAGNHDFALGPFLTNTIGMQIYPGHYTATIQGKKIHAHHGDGVLPSAVGYRLLHTILRNPVNQWFFKLLPPDLSIPLATLFSGISRKFSPAFWTEKKRKLYLKIARQYLNSGDDIVIMGHTHHPELYDCAGKWYCNTGDWLRNYSYAQLKNGELCLLQHRAGQSPRPFEVVKVT